MHPGSLGLSEDSLAVHLAESVANQLQPRAIGVAEVERAADLLVRRPSGIEGVWKLEIQPEALAERNGEAEFEEVLVLSGGMLATSQTIQLPAAQYTLSPSSDKSVSFTAVQEGDEKGRYAWSGTLRDGELLGTLLRIMPNGSETSYSFRGERQQPT